MNLKALIEKRSAKLQRMKEILEGCEKEERAFSEDESKEYEGLKNEVRELNKTIDEMRTFKPEDEPQNEGEKAEERAFADYVVAAAENRAGEQNIDIGNNGAIIPKTIVNKIITAVKDICPIFERCDLYNIKGDLAIPVYGDSSGHNVKMAYAAEFTELTADAGKFTSVELKGNLAGCLTLIGKRVINSAGIDVISFLTTYIARDIAEFIEGELLVGTGAEGHCTGATSTTNVVTAASASVLTADELITLQSKIKQAFQADACWTMNPDTFTAIRKLKNSDGDYLLIPDFSGETPYRLLGKPVYVSDNMPTIAAGAKAVLYGDYKGIACNIHENVEMQVLVEKYATQHAVGIVSWVEIDSKVTDSQKLAVLQMKTA